MVPNPGLSITDFDYLLPPEQIAQFPLENRDASRLLVCKDSVITEDLFSGIGNYLPEKSLLVFNDTRVIRARLIFAKETGATIEIFCLEPIAPVKEMQAAFAQKELCTWSCLVGNLKRWKEGRLVKHFEIEGEHFSLFAEKKEALGDGCFAIEFHWEPANLAFSTVLERAGLVPLPPYINRASSETDHSRYQTIFAHYEGSVAAPTAGLHFTESVLEELRKKEISAEKVTLHVGLGTFRPVSAPDISQHIMHSEKIIVQPELIRQLAVNTTRPVVAVGTTSARTLESLYWLGVKLIVDGDGLHPEISQWDPYEERFSTGIPRQEALSALLDYLERKGMSEYSGSTQLMIVPGYSYRIVNGLITNFHLPQSTLLLLIAAFIGDDWKTAYQYALEHGFRFLSYGDACLFFPGKIKSE